MCVSEIPTQKNSAPTAFDNENYFDRTDGEKIINTGGWLWVYFRSLTKLW